MKTIRKTEGEKTSFIINDLDPKYHRAVIDLYFGHMEEGFAKSFPKDTPNLDRIYQNFGRYAEEMILQAAKFKPVQWDKSLLAFMKIIRDEKINWWLVGSAALAVRGIDIAPRDIDLVVDGASAVRLGDLLLDYLVEPVLSSEGWIARWFGRAFLHARLEWVGDVNDDVDKPNVTDFGPEAIERSEVIKWHGNVILVPPLDLQLQVSERRGLLDRVEKIRHFLK